jgi:hypothetical protein
MPDFTGRLTVINSQSSLDNDLLLRAGIADPTQAIFAATQFLLKTKHLVSGQTIVVTGDRGSFGAVSIIVMTDAQAAGPELAIAGAPPVTRRAARIRRSKEQIGKKSASASRKSKAGVSKKVTAASKRRAAKSSRKK